MSIRYVVGLDVGDGESSIAWVPADSLPGEPAALFEYAPGQMSIVTAYAQRADDTYVIGDEALLTDGMSRIQVNFKSKPALGNGNVAQPMQAPLFAHLFWLEFQTRHPDVANDCIIYVGCPAGWSVQEAAFYQAQLEANLKPRTVVVVPESQSAFLYVYDSAKINPELRPVLVVDVGSFTTDFSLIEKNSENLPFGDALGSRDIDEAIREAVIVQLPVPDQNWLRSSRDAMKFLLWLARQWKEAAFGAAVPQRPEGSMEHQQFVLRTCWDALAAFPVSSLVDRKWRPRLRRELGDVRTHLQGRHPRLILTTGGGSRMPFIDDLCSKTFPGVNVNPAPEPFLAVARGLASYGRWRHRVDVFCARVASLADSAQIGDIVRRDATSFVERFYRSYLSRIVEEIYLPIIDEVEAGGDPAELLTLQALYRRHTSWLDTPDGNADRAKILGPLEGAIDRELVPRAAALCREFGLDAESLVIDIHLPAGLALKARDPWYDKLLKGMGILNVPIYKSGLTRWYLRKTAFLLKPAQYMANVGLGVSVASKLQELSEEQVKDLTESIRDEVRSQLVAKVEPIERLLAVWPNAM